MPRIFLHLRAGSLNGGRTTAWNDVLLSGHRRETRHRHLVIGEPTEAVLHSGTTVLS
jgi:hypothetical protein